MKLPIKAFDMTGRKYGKLLAIAPNHIDNRRYICWEFICECGKRHIAAGGLVRTGNIRSCGCARKETLKKLTASKKHGLARTPTYNVWRGIKSRCNNPNNPSYPWYGGRGIKMCPRWGDFALFLKDMGIRPGPQYTFDRIDNNGNYEPANCRWATQDEQRNNRSVSAFIEWNGERLTVAQWARKFKLSAYKRKQLYDGMPIDRVIALI